MIEDCICATHGQTVVWNHLTCWKINSWSGTAWRWRRQALIRVRVT